MEHATQNPNQMLLWIGIFMQSEVHMNLCMVRGTNEKYLYVCQMYVNVVPTIFLDILTFQYIL